MDAIDKSSRPADAATGAETPRESQQAERLEAMADWFTMAKTMTIEHVPTGLIAACRAGAKALREKAAR